MKGIKMSIAMVILGFLSLLSTTIGDHGEYWRRIATESWQKTLDAYEKNPAEVVAHINMHTKRHLEKLDGEKNRRALTGEAAGACKATNPIDECWRCKPWSGENRFKLADCAMGFGSKATGGKGGELYTVNDSSDDDVADPKPGTLRYGVTRKGPVWVVFAKDMVITLKQELIIASNKTIDGRGSIIEIANGAALSIFFSDNIIVHGIHVHDIIPTPGGKIISVVDYVGPRSKSDGDGMQIYAGTNIWVDHCTMSKCADGIIDIIQGSTAVTVSNCLFTDHDHTLLFGAKDEFLEDKKMQVTVAFNHFGEGLVQRMPACRHGFFHVVNNDYTHWKMYAIGGRADPTIILQGNRFVAGDTAVKEVSHRDAATKEVWSKWTWVTDGDKYENGAFFVESGDQEWHKKHPDITDHIEPAPADRVEEMTQFAGALHCTNNDAC